MGAPVCVPFPDGHLVGLGAVTLVDAPRGEVDRHQVTASEPQRVANTDQCSRPRHSGVPPSTAIFDKNRLDQSACLRVEARDNRSILPTAADEPELVLSDRHTVRAWYDGRSDMVELAARMDDKYRGAA
ncbi:MAG: hypothetical protein O3B42_03340 [Actinomycetota bacterium]|nr:hypothetical protein [Actinomycetota bacterium]